MTKTKLNKPLEPGDVTNLTRLRRYLNIKPTDWDAILVTDGSANQWNSGNGLGWAGVVFQRDKLVAEIHHGSASSGTNNVAELMAVFYPLLALESADLGVRQNGYRVHIVSDSSYVCRGINSNLLKFLMTISSNRSLWYGIYGATCSGLVLKAHHVSREDLIIQKLMHNVANWSRTKSWYAAKDEVVQAALKPWAGSAEGNPAD